MWESVANDLERRYSFAIVTMPYAVRKDNISEATTLRALGTRISQQIPAV